MSSNDPGPSSPPSPPRHAPPPAQPRGAFILSHWIPFDIWSRIAACLTSVSDLNSFLKVCRAAYYAVCTAQAPHHKSVCHLFCRRQFRIPVDMTDKVIIAHVVPPDGHSLVMFLDETQSGNGVQLAWIRDACIRRVQLGLDTVSASTVTNIRFSPDGSRIAFLITLAHGNLIPEHHDPLHRLRGWESSTEIRGQLHDVTYEPCEDCTVQTVSLVADSLGFPHDLVVHTFTHVFVPEYGFDMVWRGTKQQPELAFAAMLHSTAGAATYLVRWKSFATPSESNFVFMACIDGASIELLHDRRFAMLNFESTRCTSRIELGMDARFIFFDTISKFGVLRFDQVDDAESTKVTRADLPNDPITSRSYCIPSAVKSGSGEVQRHDRVRQSAQESDKCRLRPHNAWAHHGSLNDEVARTSRMAPNGKLLCSVVCIHCGPHGKNGKRISQRHIEMRSSVSGRLLYRQVIPPTFRTALSTTKRVRIAYEKSDDVARCTIGFSEDSCLLFIWDTLFTNAEVEASKRLPHVYEAETGRLVQDFNRIASTVSYDQIQTAPDGLTLYGTRWAKARVNMDAIDVISGFVLKTEVMTENLAAPAHYSCDSVYILPDKNLVAMSRGKLDSFWETTRGSLGCRWESERRRVPYCVKCDSIVMRKQPSISEISELN
ncbi:unnamed protein product [Agarophyton chilense]|eukprot:gb/GEZJ01004959.1/.p1 GENE.gb/GEZJ01004959.1/~~gb/GEZJ01004959.1/.p1  ORF type:complete len:733 (-),score=63.37 gb/GEZJ01004959.1/:2362-4338(-)